MHSHVAGVAEAVRGRSVGFALKLHQRAWAIQQGIRTVTWTFDPLVRRNAYFNIVKLGARAREYLVDFYGDMDDAINEGQGSDRLLVAWDLGSPAVCQACGGARVQPDPADLERATTVLAETGSGRPMALRARRRFDGPVLVQVPADIEALRRSDPRLARDWRLAVRDVLGELVTAGAEVTGFAKTGGYVVVPKSVQ
jgi:predicted GNAT superfamily acetyltransferase